MDFLNEDDLITVVIPVHASRKKNGMLDRAVRSAKHQKLAPAEILVVEDLKKEGAAKTRQRGLEQVTTKWVAFLDSDDLFMPQHLLKLMKCAKQNNADIVYSWYKISGGRDPMPKHFGKPWDPKNPRLTTIVTLCKTEIAQQVGFVHKHDGTKLLGEFAGEDWFFIKGCNDLGAKIVHLPERTWVWNHHGKNTSGLPNKGDAK